MSVLAQRRGNRNGQDDEVASEDRFDYLDINGNGYIDRNEWDGGQNAFDRLDTNDDRRLAQGSSTPQITATRTTSRRST